jgi:hypothetical protein
MSSKFSLFRGPLTLSALLTFFFALWGGLVRMLWHFPVPQADWISYHGPLILRNHYRLGPGQCP